MRSFEKKSGLIDQNFARFCQVSILFASARQKSSLGMSLAWANIFPPGSQQQLIHIAVIDREKRETESESLWLTYDSLR